MSPFVIIIFGATGDLAKTKLVPALFSLFKQNLLSEDFFIIGFARREMSAEQFHETFISLTSDKKWSAFAKHLSYQQGFFGEEQGYKELITRLKEIDDKLGACITRLFYLATPPQNYEEILVNLSSTKLSEGSGQGSIKWTRVVIEKPFGKDLETAKALDKLLADKFEEQQIFRVDHYLGKETVQNILAFRFANSIFEPVWNKQYIDHVQVTLMEKDKVGRRGKFFDGVGQLRDVGQNHLLQLVAAVAMEQPKSFSNEGVRDARAAVMRAIKPMTSEEVKRQVVRGQYEGYTKEPNVDPASQTETYIAMKLSVDTQRFSGVPFYIRAGKSMKKDFVEISIVFTQTCHILFKEFGCPEFGNVLTFRIQPDEGIRLRVIAKQPAAKLALQPVDMKFSYDEQFGGHGQNAYEKILMDIFAGDQMLFNRSDELESSWDFITQILDGWGKQKEPIKKYTAGTWGPKEADQLTEKDARKWFSMV